MDIKLNGNYKNTCTRVKQLIYDKRLNTFAEKAAYKELKLYLYKLQTESKDIEETDNELAKKFSINILPISKLEKVFMCFLFPSIYIGLLFLIEIIVFKRVVFDDINLATVLGLSVAFGWQVVSKNETKELYGIIIALSMIVVVPVTVWIIPNFRFVVGISKSIVVIVICVLVFVSIFGVQKLRYNKWMKGNKNG